MSPSARTAHSLCVDVVVHLASGQQLEARGTGADAHAAFDEALIKLETRVRRYKRRLKKPSHPSGRPRRHGGNGLFDRAPRR